jgi:hypothetical protein
MRAKDGSRYGLLDLVNDVVLAYFALLNSF